MLATVQSCKVAAVKSSHQMQKKKKKIIRGTTNYFRLCHFLYFLVEKNCHYNVKQCFFFTIFR